MNKTEAQKHIEFCKKFLTQLTTIQNALLNLQLKKTQPQLGKLFEKSSLYFATVFEKLAAIERVSKYFILKKCYCV